MSGAAGTSLDTPENRHYIHAHRLWTLGDIVTNKLIQTRPEHPVSTIIAALTELRQRPQALTGTSTQEEAAEAKEYLATHQIAALIEAWLRTLLEHKPADPLQYSIEVYFQAAAP